MVIVAHPDDADFGPAGTMARWIDAGTVGHLICCTSGDAGADDHTIDPLELAATREAEQRAAAADHRLRGGDLPARAGRRAGQRPGAARAAGGRHPGVPPGRRADDGPLHAVQPLRAHPAHRPSRRGHGGGRRRVPGGPQRDGLPAPGTGRPGAAHGALAVPVLDGSGRRVGRHQRLRSSASWRPCAPTPARSATRPTWSSGCASGRARTARGSARPRRRASGSSTSPEISPPWPSATAARGPTGSTGRPASPTGAPGGPRARSATAPAPCLRGTRRRPR